MNNRNVSPTKNNLMEYQSSLDLAQEGYELLDKKRNILIREMTERIDEAEEVQSQINKYFYEAYQALQTVDIMMGIETVEQIGTGMELIEEVEIKNYSVMGVEIPMVKTISEEIEPRFSLYTTRLALDQTYKNFKRVVKLITRLAEIETSVYRLATSIKKTQKRANALENIQIPKYKGIVKFIEESLEEKEREQFFRSKLIKQKKTE